MTDTVRPMGMQQETWAVTTHGNSLRAVIPAKPYVKYIPGAQALETLLKSRKWHANDSSRPAQRMVISC